ncbi:MAG: PqqD family protein [Nitrospirota bacterium]
MSREKFQNYKKNPSVLCTELDDGGVLLNLDTKYYYTLNSTGLRIWQIMDELKDPLEIAQKLVIEYEVDKEKAMASVARLLEMLEQEKLIIPSDI